MRRIRMILGSALILLAGLSQAADSGIAITGATVHTLMETGPMEGAVLLIKDGRIKAIAADLEIPPGYARVDATGKVVTPGLIESYSRLGLIEIAGETSTVDAYVSEYPSGAAFNVRYALNPAAVALAVNRRDGVTRAVTAPAPGNDPFAGWGAAIRLGGEPMLVKPDLAMFAAIGAGTSAFVGGSRSAVIQRLRRGLAQAAAYSSGRYQPGPGDFSHQDLAALKAFRRSGAPLAVNVNRANEIREAVLLADDYGLDLIVIGGAEAWRVTDLLREKSIPVVIETLANLPRSYDGLGARLDNARLLHEAGVKVLIGALDTNNARNIRQMAGNAVTHGLPWAVALAAITREPARVWRFEAGAGTLAPGAPADLVIWTGDPLELTEWADAVMIDGQWQDMTSRQTRLFDRYRNLDDPDRAYP